MQHPNHVRKIYQNLDLIIIKRTAHCLMEYIEQLSIFLRRLEWRQYGCCCNFIHRDDTKEMNRVAFVGKPKFQN